jgi:hypothetical protein
MADNWAPGQAGYTSPYAKDFNPDSSGFKISMRKKQCFNWDYGSYGIMDNGGVTSQDQWGSGSTARSSGPGTNLGTGRVDIRNVGTPAEFDPSRNFKTLRNASYTTGRGFMKAAKGFGKMANGLMANNANRLNTKLANAQQAQQEAQEAQVQKQQLAKDLLLLGNKWIQWVEEKTHMTCCNTQLSSLPHDQRMVLLIWITPDQALTSYKTN